MYIQKKHKLSPFLNDNKDICQAIQQYAHEHLHELSIKFMHEYIHDAILLNMVKEEWLVLPNEGEKYEAAVWQILGQHGLTCICPSMVDNCL